MSVVNAKLIVDKEMRNEMKTLNLPELQKQYDAMVKIAIRSMDNDVDLEPAFEKELTNLMRLVKSLGGKV